MKKIVTHHMLCAEGLDIFQFPKALWLDCLPFILLLAQINLLRVIGSLFAYLIKLQYSTSSVIF